MLDWEAGEHPKHGNAIIGVNPSNPHVLIRANGGHDVMYLAENLSRKKARRLGRLIVEELLEQDYVGGLFVNDKRLGRIRGALSMEYIAPDGVAAARLPDIVVSFVSMNMGCDRPTTCTAMISETTLQEGQEIPGVFSRADTWTFMAARGPDFQSRFISRAPASNADIARTIGELLRIDVGARTKLGGQVLTESLRGSEGKGEPRVREYVVASKASIDGLLTEVHLQSVGPTQYFDAAGFPGLTVGVKYRPPPVDWRWWRWDWPHPKSFSIDIRPD